MESQKLNIQGVWKNEQPEWLEIQFLFYTYLVF